MRLPSTTALFGGVLIVATACASGGTERVPSAPTPDPADLEAAAQADSVRRHYTQADVDFMTGMIHHHAQALVMARMAPTHGASPTLQTLAARIINSQLDEIRLMQRWLRERDEPVPQVDESGRVHMPGDADGADHHGHGGHGGAEAAMAGMLSPSQIQRLDEARGAEWNRLFLTYMIQHHQGARIMVDRLFATDGAAQGDETFQIAANIDADQAAEIDRMQRMLAALVFETDGNQS